MTDFQTAADGKKFELWMYDANATPSPALVFVCLAASASLNRQKNYDSYMSLDCDNPHDAPSEKHNVTGRSWSIPISGIVDLTRFRLFRELEEGATPVAMELRHNVALAAGGGKYSGNFHLESLEEGHQERGTVRFTATLRGDGPVTWTDATA